MTTILVTRPQPDIAITSGKLLAMGIDPISLSLLRRVVLATDLPEPSGFAALAVTSANALRALKQRGVLNAFRSLPVYAVGDGTAAEADMHGFTRIFNAAGDITELATLIASKRPDGAVFYPAAKKRSGDLGAALGPHGIAVETVAVYDMAPPEAITASLIDIIAVEVDAVLLYSRRSAEAFRDLIASKLSDAARRRMTVLAISANTAEPLKDAGFGGTLIAEHTDDEAMMTLALAFARGQNTA